MDKIKVGIIGTGSIASFHARAYQKQPNAEIYALCDLNRERALKFAEEYGVNPKRVFTDLAEMLALPELDAVSVCTWNNAHMDASVRALEAGKHVLCEKPLAMNAGQAQQMIDAEKASGKLLMVGFVRRFAGSTKAAMDAVTRGDIGKVHYAKVSILRRWGNPGGWFSDKKRSGGGPVIDLGVHVIDLVRYLCGKPNAVSVYGSCFYDVGMMPGIQGINKYYSKDYSEFNDVEDGATAMVRFDDGMMMLVETCWTRNIKQDEMRLQLFGDKGGLQLEPTFEIYERRGDYLTDVTPVLKRQGFDMDEIFAAETAHFLSCIQNGTPCMNPSIDGLALMKILDAIYASAQSGHEVQI